MRTASACRRRLCLWLLLLVGALLMLELSTLFNLNKEVNFHSADPPLLPLLRFPGPPELEVIVDSRDVALELGLDLAPLKSLREDQLLLVAPATRGTGSRQQRKRSYKLVGHGERKNEAAREPYGPGKPRPKGGIPQQNGARESVQKYGFSQALSDAVSLHRGLPETRLSGCFGESYSEFLPSASVVICFHEEAWSTLLRTVHSVIDTSPRAHLREILLVDDLSQSSHLKEALTKYVSGLEGVRLIRSSKRLGVGRCRAMAAGQATGEVLVFMDSHCECQRGWLEPLLERVAQDRTRVVSPIMDVIDWRTFQYNATQWPVRGVFDWNLDFHWESNLQLEGKHPDGDVLPVRSPCLGEGVLAIDRRFFQSVGGYDPGMLLWGAEQIELSIRVWCCGGSMEVVPCSRVAHLKHHHVPYVFTDEDMLERNKIRVADIWMDAYRKIFYRRNTAAHFLKQSESPPITERLRLKRSLGCRNFRWFLSTVYPELYIPQDRPGLSGELYNVGTGSCADPPAPGKVMNISPCSGTGSQHWDLNSEGQLRWGPMGNFCLDAKGDRLVLSPCPTNQPTKGRMRWKFMKLSGQILHQPSQLCVETEEVQSRTGGEKVKPSGGGVFLRQCMHHPWQQWHFEQLVAPKGA